MGKGYGIFVKEGDLSVQGTTTQTKRRIRVTAGNIRNSHIYITGNYDFFPEDCFGDANLDRGRMGKPVCICVEGTDQAVETDIARDSRTGKPRREFRARAWIREFFRKHHVRPGDVLELHRLSERRYSLRLAAPPSDDDTEPCFRVAEFFAGIGLVRIALERHGFKVIFANDIAPDKLELYRANLSTDDFRLGDIHQIRGREVPDCDLVTASFPCTDLSIAGAMKGIHSGESSAFWGLIRLLREMGSRRPAMVMLENVPGFLLSNKGEDFETAMLALNELGYAVDTFFLDAASFVPQSRLRMFVIGRRDVARQSIFGLKASSLRPDALLSFINSHPEINWNLREIPAPPQQRTRLESILEDLPDEDPTWWCRERADYFISQLSDRHLAIAKAMIAGQTYSYGTAFRRVRNGRSMAELRTDGLAGCLRTPKGGSGRQILFKAGKGRYQVRLLTARECARLQGVLDSYRINVPLNKALFGFGDAVCVPAIEWIAKHYLRSCLRESWSVIRNETSYG